MTVSHLTCKRMQHCWLTSPNIVGCYSCVHLHTLLHTPFVHPVVHSICTPCCILLSVIGSGCAKFETGQTFEPTTPNISFVLYLQSVTRKYWIRLHSSSNIVGATHAPKMAVEVLWGCIPSIMHCRSQHFWELFHPFSHHYNTDATTVFVLLAQQCWELLRPFARSSTYQKNVF